MVQKFGLGIHPRRENSSGFLSISLKKLNTTTKVIILAHSCRHRPQRTNRRRHEMLSKIKKYLVTSRIDGGADNRLPHEGPNLQARDEEANESDLEISSDGAWDGGADGDIELEDLTSMSSDETDDYDSDDDVFFDALESLTLDEQKSCVLQ